MKAFSFANPIVYSICSILFWTPNSHAQNVTPLPFEIVAKDGKDQNGRVISTAFNQYQVGFDSDPLVFQMTPEEVASVQASDSLVLQGHRLGFSNPSFTENVPAKLAVSLNGGPFVEIVDVDHPRAANPPKVKFDLATERAGGIHGAFNTSSVYIALSALVNDTQGGLVKVGRNTLRFRFNKTDGVSSSARILNFNFHGPQGLRFAGNRFSSNSNYGSELSIPRGGVVERGRQLFERRNILRENPLKPSEFLKSSCVDCHAQGGRDLHYYGFSNKSIIARAQFHGLSEEDGRNIAAYIRSRNQSVLPYGRPWDPPFQPGPGLDNRPNARERWAAGAGLGAVLPVEDGTKMLPQLLGVKSDLSDLNTEKIRDAIRGNGFANHTINLRQMQIALQLPDWNDWVPHYAPVDLLPEVNATDSAKPVYCDSSVATVNIPANSNYKPGTCLEELYSSVRNQIAVNSPVDNLEKAKSVKVQLTRFAKRVLNYLDGPVRQTVGFAGPWRRTDDELKCRVANNLFATDLTACRAQAQFEHNKKDTDQILIDRRKNYSDLEKQIDAERRMAAEFIRSSVYRWAAVKTWELVTEFQLQSVERMVNPRFGEKFSLPVSQFFTVFILAPHFTASNATYFETGDLKQSPLIGKTESTLWYHLQPILNSGGRERVGIGAVDWPYQYNHITASNYDAVKRLRRIGHHYYNVQSEAFANAEKSTFESIRYMAILIKAFQMRDNHYLSDSPNDAANMGLIPEDILARYVNDGGRSDAFENTSAFSWSKRYIGINWFLSTSLNAATAETLLGEPVVGQGRVPDDLLSGLNRFQPGLHVKLVEAMLAEHLAKNRSLRGQWVSCKVEPSRSMNLTEYEYCVRSPESFEKDKTHIASLVHDPFKGVWTEDLAIVTAKAIPKLQNVLGANHPYIKQYKVWANSLWPSDYWGLNANDNVMQCEDSKIREYGKSSDPTTLTKFVYCLTLKRLPDGVGGPGMEARIRENIRTIGKLAALEREITPIILGSREFQLNYWNPISDDKHFVDSLYKTILLMEKIPSDENPQWHIDALQAKKWGRAKVVSDFINYYKFKRDILGIN